MRLFHFAHGIVEKQLALLEHHVEFLPSVFLDIPLVGHTQPTLEPVLTIAAAHDTTRRVVELIQRRRVARRHVGGIKRRRCRAVQEMMMKRMEKTLRAIQSRLKYTHVLLTSVAVVRAAVRARIAADARVMMIVVVMMMMMMVMISDHS